MSGHCSRRAMRAAVALAGILVVALVAPGPAAATGTPRLAWTPCFTDPATLWYIATSAPNGA